MDGILDQEGYLQTGGRKNRLEVVKFKMQPLSTHLYGVHSLYVLIRVKLMARKLLGNRIECAKF